MLVLSYPAYCRYRSTLKRLEGHNQKDYMRQAVVEAIGGRAAPSQNTRVVFCKDTFDYPELEDHELLCNHLGNDVDYHTLNDFILPPSTSFSLYSLIAHY